MSTGASSERNSYVHGAGRGKKIPVSFSFPECVFMLGWWWFVVKNSHSLEVIKDSSLFSVYSSKSTLNDASIKERYQCLAGLRNDHEP